MTARTEPVAPAIAGGGYAAIEPTAEALRCTGAWTLEGIVGLEQRIDRRRWPEGEILLDGSAIDALDTSGALLLIKTIDGLQQDGRRVRLGGLRPEHQALVTLVRERRAAAGEASAPPRPEGVLARLGRLAWDHVEQGMGFLAFVGEAAIALGRSLLQPSRIRWKALFATIESAGINALPIIALLSFLMGVVIAYQGGEQLKTYGANIFIVELVTLTMLRELAPLMTAIIVAGRTGSAFTAQIGTMKVTEEVDALRTIGIAPMEILVLPKLLALVIVLPLLSMFADVLGVFGGMVIAYFLLDVSFVEFINRIPQVVFVTSSFLIGVGKAPVFAAIIALVGCYQGFQVSGGADSVGHQTTLSVVQAIFMVILADAFFSVLFGALGV